MINGSIFLLKGRPLFYIQVIQDSFKINVPLDAIIISNCSSSSCSLQDERNIIK